MPLPHVQMGLGAVAEVRGERHFLPLEKKIDISKFVSLSGEWDCASSKFPPPVTSFQTGTNLPACMFICLYYRLISEKEDLWGV